MAKGHRSQIKRERNAVKDTRPSAKLSYARVSVQKACFVLDAIRGKSLEEALGIVMYNPRYASSLIEKLLKSAAANAENNNGMDPSKLYVEECYANKGPTMAMADQLKKLHAKGISFHGVIAADDSLALGALKYGREMGLRIPEDLSIIGYNNSMLVSCCDPELTSIDNKLETLCQHLITTLMGVLEGNEMPK